jgi:hypothetical protein
MDRQLRAQFDALAQQKEALANAYRGQMDIAGTTRDQQLGIAGTTRDQQLGVAQGVLDNQLGLYRPYNEAGLAGQNRLLEYLGIGGSAGAKDYGKYASAEFTPDQFLANQDPGYGFRMSEGLKAVDRQAAARGGLISGNALKASQTYGQDMASQEYQNAFNRFQTSRAGTLSPYQSLQGVGFNAATGMVNAYDRFGDRSIGAYDRFGDRSIGAYGGYGSAAGGAVGNYGSAAGGATGAYGNNTANIYGTSGSNVSNIYGQIGTQEQQAYGNYINGLTGALTGYGNNATNLATSGANATASGYVGQANAINQGISGVSNAYYQNQLLAMLKKPQPFYNEAEREA